MSTDDFWALEPLFGSEAWNNAGLLAPAFEEDDNPASSSTTPSSPFFEPEAISVAASPESSENVSTQTPIMYQRPKRVFQDTADSVVITPQKKPRNRPCIAVTVAHAAHIKALDLLAKGGDARLDRAYDLFLSCYRQNTSYRWQGCLGLAQTCLLQGKESEAFTYFKRIEKGQLCPLDIKIQACEFKHVYLEKKLGFHAQD